METMVGIATFPSGELVMCPGTIVGRGLAVVRLPEPDEDGRPVYSVTHAVTGYGLSDIFFNRALAVRCARELIRLFSFEFQTVSEARKGLQGSGVWWNLLHPIVTRYLKLDDMWCNREAGQLDG